MKNVILITTSYPDAETGSSAAGSFVMDFALELSKYVKVTVVTPAYSTSKTIDGNLTVHRFAVRRLPLSLLKASNPLHWLAIVSTLQSGKQQVSVAAGDNRPDYILALWALPSGYWARAIARQYNSDYGVWALGSDIWVLGRIPVVRTFLASVLNQARHRYADGYLLAEDVQRLSGQSCTFLPSTRDFTSADGRMLKCEPPYRLVFLGRWHLNKGIDLLLQALADLPSEDWAKIEDIRICGGGPLNDDVIQGIERLQVVGKPVSCGGYLDKSQAAELLSSGDYTVIPSRIESIPVIFSDCMKARSAIITTPVGDLPQLVEKYGVGICAREITSEALGSAISQALRAAPSAFSDGMDTAAQAFDLPNVVQNFLKKSLPYPGSYQS